MTDTTTSVDSDNPAPARLESTPPSPTHFPSTVQLLTVTAVALPVFLYFLFLHKFAINVLFWDDWSNIALVHQWLHGSTPWSALWVQHNENRMLIPNLIDLLFSRIFSLDTVTTIVIDGGIMTASLVLVLLAYRRYSKRALSPLATLAASLVWLSLADYQNALWAFQLAWYLVLICFAGCTYLLARPEGIRWPGLVSSLLLAIIASFSSFQGLLIWPALLLGILLREGVSRKALTWVCVGAACGVIYFWGFTFTSIGGGSVSGAIAHPWSSIRYFLELIGSVIPIDATGHPQLHEALGATFVLASVSIAIISVRDSRQRLAVPAVLIGFALLFDLFITFGRASIGVLYATSSRFTMPNLVLVVALSLYPSTITMVVRGECRRYTHLLRVASNLLVSVLATIVAVSGVFAGWQGGRSELQDRRLGAFVLVDLNNLSPTFAYTILDNTLYPYQALGGVGHPLYYLAKEDHLSVFMPSASEKLSHLSLAEAERGVFPQPPRSLSTQGESTAWDTLMGLYLARADLQVAFPADQPGSGQRLLEWSCATGLAVDSPSVLGPVRRELLRMCDNHSK